eukprot:TRINITY_DN7836_c0_g1_i4.p1 TRINITY_DN7836_c0_g1~~TRINITY_DN7836_c0_g1_i4.p1  ORF type:complete len:110 (-),score=23.97 TRINITY_DN7836_c0_g1_i4:407-691(-)
MEFQEMFGLVSEPLLKFKDYFARVNSEWCQDFVLSTVSAEGCPSSRLLSLHTFDERGFYFCTNTCSPKVRDFGTLFYCSLCRSRNIRWKDCFVL